MEEQGAKERRCCHRTSSLSYLLSLSFSVLLSFISRFLCCCLGRSRSIMCVILNHTLPPSHPPQKPNSNISLPSCFFSSCSLAMHRCSSFILSASCPTISAVRPRDETDVHSSLTPFQSLFSFCFILRLVSYYLVLFVCFGRSIKFVILNHRLRHSHPLKNDYNKLCKYGSNKRRRTRRK